MGYTVFWTPLLHCFNACAGEKKKTPAITPRCLLAEGHYRTWQHRCAPFAAAQLLKRSFALRAARRHRTALLMGYAGAAVLGVPTNIFLQYCRGFLWRGREDDAGDSPPPHGGEPTAAPLPPLRTTTRRLLLRGDIARTPYGRSHTPHTFYIHRGAAWEFIHKSTTPSRFVADKSGGANNVSCACSGRRDHRVNMRYQEQTLAAMTEEDSAGCYRLISHGSLLSER